MWCFAQFMFQRKDLVLLNLISRHMTFSSQRFFKSKNIADLCKVNFCISKLFCINNIIQVAAVCSEQVVLIYFYVCVSLLAPVCSLCVCLCVISNQSTSKNHIIRVKASVNVMQKTELNY